ncbi:hypothetical protein QP228_008255 [Pseudoglutamicibacter cumminsii]|uniref:hypothetical protein n=1 Tax=Pseudoglutamicibacter cumminsii TaxID=156979 RepID=UPI002553F2B2|nr:hypothetical protein [Pseudoglutamicibacter cumminsii]MDZ3745960.1 hypothetical protein [Pseudoglutamicibacter cumminsii]
MTEPRAYRAFAARCVTGLLAIGLLTGCAHATEEKPTPSDTPSHDGGATSSETAASSDATSSGSSTGKETASGKETESASEKPEPNGTDEAGAGETGAEDAGQEAPQFADIRFDILNTLATMSTYKASGTTTFKGLTIDFVGVFHRQPAHAMALEGQVTGTRADGQLVLLLDEDTVYLRGDRDFWDGLGAGAQEGADEHIQNVVDKYVSMTPLDAQLDNLDPVRLSDLMLATIKWDSFTEPPEETEFNGKKVLKYLGADDVVIYIDAESHELHTIDTRIGGHMVQFSHFNLTALIPQPEASDTVPWSTQ